MASNMYTSCNNQIVLWSFIKYVSLIKNDVWNMFTKLKSKEIARGSCIEWVQCLRLINVLLNLCLKLRTIHQCLCWVSTLFCMICCLFSNCSKNSTTRLRVLYEKKQRKENDIVLKSIALKCFPQWNYINDIISKLPQESLWFVFSKEKTHVPPIS